MKKILAIFLLITVCCVVTAYADLIALQAHNGKFVSANLNKNGMLIADRGYIRGWEKFDLIKLDDGKYAIQAANGKFVSADLNKRGVYTIQQKSTGRYVDAHESGNDYALVTRTPQLNATQQWIIKDVSKTLTGGVCTIQQKSTGRYVDAHESGNDYALVTRTPQLNETQQWIINPL